MSDRMIVHSGRRGLRCVDGRFEEVLEPGRHPLPRRRFGHRRPTVVIVVRERELNVKGQEILTADKVAARVDIIARFRVTDPKAAAERVADHNDRIYSKRTAIAHRSDREIGRCTLRTVGLATASRVTADVAV